MRSQLYQGIFVILSLSSYRYTCNSELTRTEINHLSINELRREWTWISVKLCRITITSSWKRFNGDWCNTFWQPYVGFTPEDGRGRAQGRREGATINSLSWAARPRKYVGAVSCRRDNRQSRPKTDARPSRSGQGHNGAVARAQYSGWHKRPG